MIMIYINTLKKIWQTKINNTYFNQVENIRELGRTFKKENNELVLEIVVEVSLKDGTIVADSLIYHI